MTGMLRRLASLTSVIVDSLNEGLAKIQRSKPARTEEEGVEAVAAEIEATPEV